MVAFVWILTGGNSTINLIIVIALMKTVEKRSTNHDKPLYGPKTTQQQQN
jgi:hypothetical protein